MKKVLSISLALFLMFTLLVGCNSTNNNGNSNSTPNQSSSEITAAPSQINENATPSGKAENSTSANPTDSKKSNDTNGNSTPSKSAEKTDSDPFYLMKTESLGPLTYSMKDQDVIKNLGNPEEKSQITNSPVDGLNHQTWKYTKKGITLDMVGDENKQAIKSITVEGSSSFPLKTKKNIGIGSSKSQVLEAYKNDINSKENPSNDTILAGSIYGGIVFTISNDKVSKIYLGASAE